MFTITRKPLTLNRIGKGIYCVGAYHPTNKVQVLHYQVYGTRGAYEVGVQYEIGQALEILGTATTLANAEQIINDHHISL